MRRRSDSDRHVCQTRAGQCKSRPSRERGGIRHPSSATCRDAMQLSLFVALFCFMVVSQQRFHKAGPDRRHWNESQAGFRFGA